MKRITLVCLLCAVLLAGCSGVRMSAEHAAVLDRTVVLSQETARRARNGELTSAQMAEALTRQAELWRTFQNARDGGQR